jgi:hypothetical protein
MAILDPIAHMEWQNSLLYSCVAAIQRASSTDQYIFGVLYLSQMCAMKR